MLFFEVNNIVFLEIYDDGLLVYEHQLMDKSFNYQREDYLEIAKSDIYSHLTEEALEARVNKKTSTYEEDYKIFKVALRYTFSCE
ncbi:hypothetical protein [Lactococcus sp. DD01]|uniref:hypothetical protein n=1 Tax=Lactococcus sp. DD01 TaxID=1776443 RepID=UPI0007762F8D|nr:hypothetical protein [Lactococcus sp. DD01]KXT60321.1 hypothetical protein LACDD01_01810 [Lactococcus sp. DD01]